jgi:hypothetical protein
MPKATRATSQQKAPKIQGSLYLRSGLMTPIPQTISARKSATGKYDKPMFPNPSTPEAKGHPLQHRSKP